MAFLVEKPCIAPSLFSRVHFYSSLAVLFPRLLHYTRTMPDPQKRIENLRKKRADAKLASKDKLANLKANLKAAEREQLDAIDRKLRSAESQLRGQARRDDTRRKILIGAAVLSAAPHKPQFKKWLAGDFPALLIRDRDRALFGLEPLPPAAEPIPGFSPATLPDHTWGAKFNRDAAKLPAKLVGRRIRIQAKSSGNTWDGTVTETIKKADGRVLFRYADKADPA